MIPPGTPNSHATMYFNAVPPFGEVESKRATNTIACVKELRACTLRQLVLSESC